MRLTFCSVLSVVLLAGCSSDDDTTPNSTSLPADCTEIVEACHEADDGDAGVVTECHELAHSGNASQCAAQKSTCLASCAAAMSDAGTGGSSGADGGGMGGMAGMNHDH